MVLLDIKVSCGSVIKVTLFETFNYYKMIIHATLQKTWNIGKIRVN